MIDLLTPVYKNLIDNLNIPNAGDKIAPATWIPYNFIHFRLRIVVVLCRLNVFMYKNSP